ncbi:DUF4912 domain-containing protein [Anabaena subtropica]|uniref:DUF4912 domain-containing protein n=1 Tax=Anabaena subtropica FACHB-260 TaxID=2692884 RepID=A0ABR8CU29_9NOST|nr:DUF4912 domain-containing protein [Anabaena subtropica]MBD2346048.1 DUF4912 domain-containing protein [Anabaena subtropica FACHB-260]
MRQKQKKDSGIVNLALLFALTTTPIATNLLLSDPMLAQSEADTPSFELPETVETGTTVRIDGSSTLVAVNQSLKQSFEQQFTGTRVDVANNGTEAALKAVLDGSIDVAAIGRGLTPEEKAQGLEQVRLHREKIAIIVGEENPFKGSLTDRQFARIFRGRITNWSQLGAPSAKIRVLDRPETSDTREALNNYPVFKAARFATGSTATQVTEDNTTEIAKQLGKDGISYARANQVSKLPGVRVLQLHDTLPDDPKYPFSQPLVYVYKKTPNPAIASFLGFALASPGQKAIETARVNEAEAIAKGESQLLLTTANPTGTPEANSSPIEGTTQIINPTAETTPATNIFPNAEGTTTNVTQPAIVAPPETPKLDRSLLWWLLLPVGAIGGLLLWFVKRPSTAKALESESTPDEMDTAAPVTEPLVEIRDHTTPIPVADTNPTVLQTISTKPVAAQESENNHNSGGYQVAIPPELEQSPWDMEAPAAVVNTSYPQMMEAGKTPTYGEQQTADITNEISQVPSAEESYQEPTENSPETTEDTQEEELAPPTTSEDTLEIVDSLPDLPDFYAIFADEDTAIAEAPAEEQTSISDIHEEMNDTTEVVIPAELPEAEITSEVTTSLPKFSDIPEDALNLVADAAEFNESETLEDTEYLTPSSLGTLASGAALAAAGTEVWASSNEIEESSPSPVPANNTSEENLPAILATTAELEDEEEESSIILKPRNSEWAYVSWYVSLTDQQRLQEQGISELALQLYDVTDIDLSYQSPQAIQQDKCEPGTSDRYISIPASDRDYMIDIGYVTVGEQWTTIARSPIVRVFDSPQIESLLANSPALDEKSTVTFNSRTPKWAYVSWDIADDHQQLLKDHGISQLALRLYDATNVDLSYQNPQLVQQYEFDEITRDRYVLIPNSDRDYMAEVGYLTTAGDWVTIARSATVRVFNSPQEDFWFVADTELIIHGATDPSATVTIAGKPITLKSDGTFHLRVPFSQDLLDYLITVSSGQQKKTIHKKFAQETSES